MFKKRSQAIDCLRGAVMVLMALDHTRDFFTTTGGDPSDVNQPFLFIVRWVTHFCAPIFIFLAGVSIQLSLGSKTISELRSFLFKRGLWIIFLEVTLVHFAWTFSLSSPIIMLQVMWAIGLSMILMAGLINLPHRILLALSIATILGHNLLDYIAIDPKEDVSWFFMILHYPGSLFKLMESTVQVLYPIIPWVAVMCLGYLFGILWKNQVANRTRLCIQMGLASLTTFVFLRTLNIYGDPAPWETHQNWLQQILAFVKVTKYPPSLFYLLITLGVALMVLGLLNALETKGREFKLLTAFHQFGKVPMFYYLAHLYLIHFMACLFLIFHHGVPAWENWHYFDILHTPPEGYGARLVNVLLFWALAVALLYPVCVWYGKVKSRSSHWLLKYI